MTFGQSSSQAALPGQTEIFFQWCTRSTPAYNVLLSHSYDDRDKKEDVIRKFNLRKFNHTWVELSDNQKVQTELLNFLIIRKFNPSQ